MSLFANSRFFLLVGTLLLFHLGAAAQVPGCTDEEQGLRVMTYNVRLDVASDGENAWPNRKEFLATQIEFHAPDVLGTQEGTPAQVDWLDGRLTDYARIGEGREGGHAGEYSAVYYNRHRLRVKDSGTFWLSETPDTVSTGWDAALPRIVTWGRFAERGGDRDFFVFNTHFDHVGEQARQNSAELILTMVDSLNKGGLPFVVTGDLNLTPETAPLQKLSAVLTDAFVAAPIRLGPVGTFTGFKHDVAATRRIDYVMVSPGVEVVNYATLTDAVDGRYASDHFAVVSTLHLRPRPLIIAHRGASGYALENSLDAFRKAVELKADMIELDVFTLKDGRVVCFHDGDLKRLTGTEGKIVDYTLAELNQLTLSDGSRIPLLSDAMKVMDKQLRLNVELKGPGTAEPTYRIIEEAIREQGWKIEDFHISSFRHDELKQMRALDDRIEIGILPHGSPVAAMEVGKEVGAYSINAYLGSLNPESVAELHDAGFKIFAWTVNSHGDIRRLLDLGIDGYITNYPDRVGQVAAE
ncbi:glycerophosphodiester phosphodiesterase family protein [Neolewinella antarctica]|uniref:Glycerophosphoryl diester phosphodiesterase/endonuclease/exonuclease/phosphatase family metal-dependent hydrolase n=1 Tax=Neolewinella antarctica TaxID=442734 RepID=A0ABX0XFM8_9BACT|nr:glycerophosphodiester phosphodiesterase family protein [Neolewinella antarctica]NJC28032.1 glycerophosphoryl diester phosphodiesterase/endonuclease/exonuclease/phosphatase family metal-dependent hydrolase [Neolewinella antarctica]